MSNERERLADSLERVLAGTADLGEILEQETLFGEPLMYCSHGLHHFLSDADIRRKDQEWRAMQEEEMHKLIALLRSNAQLTDLERISFLWPTSAADVANVGLIRPPLVYLGSIGLGLLVNLFWPMELLPASVSVPVGVLVVLVAGALFISAVRTLRKAGTPVPGNRPTTTIVRAGPFGFSRNPIYLAFTLFQVGLAAWVNSLGMLLALLPALALMALVVIPREERYLEARFPSEYLGYKRAVRRWL